MKAKVLINDKLNSIYGIADEFHLFFGAVFWMNTWDNETLHSHVAYFESAEDCDKWFYGLVNKSANRDYYAVMYRGEKSMVFESEGNLLEREVA